jgi:hypothetical protein
MRRRERRKEQVPIGGIKSCIKLACAITYILYGQSEFHSYKLQPRKSQTPGSIYLEFVYAYCIRELDAQSELKT